MKKIVSLILSVVIILSVTSCTEESIKYDEGEVLAAAEELIVKSGELNTLFWGNGIEYMEDDLYKNGYYYPANPLSLIKYGVRTVEDMREMAREVFSFAYCESIFSSVLSAAGDEDVIAGYTRYYQGSYTVMVYSLAKILLSDEVEYLTDTIKIVGADSRMVYVTVSATVTRDEATQTRDIKIGFVYENGGWKINTPTYMTYQDDEDIK
ncbi:MAG: hypothetical protein J6V09_04935 [Clostridia bacterium]|nr:hypothetical protein [Clostridia bacterium]